MNSIEKKVRKAFANVDITDFNHDPTNRSVRFLMSEVGGISFKDMRYLTSVLRTSDITFTTLIQEKHNATGIHRAVLGSFNAFNIGSRRLHAVPAKPKIKRIASKKAAKVKRKVRKVRKQSKFRR